MPEHRTSARNRKLRNLLVNPRYQLRYVFWLSASGLGLILINSYFFYRSTKENYDILVDLSPMTEAARLQLYRELDETVIRLAVFSVLFVAVVSFLGLLYSHRTAGPLYHFKRVFREIRNGKKDARVRLRPKDDFQDVAAEFNEMMDHVTGPR